tara:strand:- start:2093 stop:2578 length:486 start_codon:yes stop_codon:yes gene_type:complete
MKKKSLNKLLSNSNSNSYLIKLSKKYPYFLLPKFLKFYNIIIQNKDYISDLNSLSIFITERGILKDNIQKILSKKNKDHKQIINSFILNNPQIKKNKKTNSSNNDLSKSNHKIRGIITENMAKIYADQNKKKESIDIYQKLMIKFPKKKAYFAQKIKNLIK